jgi:2-dehydro-3-deoxygluconokinase
MVFVTPTNPESLENAESFRLRVGGAESNVSVHLTQLGHKVAWASAVGKDPLGHRIRTSLEAHGLSTDYLIEDDFAPTGVYFKDPGKSMYYYRTGSAASKMTSAVANTLPLGNVRIVHLTGITPALSESCLELTHAMATRARENQALVSFDVNYRPALWAKETAQVHLHAIGETVDILFVGLDEADALWGCSTLEGVRELFPSVPYLVIKNDAHGATEFSKSRQVFSPAPETRVVEAVGAGDAFAAGYLSGFLDGLASERRLEKGHARAQTVLQSTSDIPQPATPPNVPEKGPH